MIVTRVRETEGSAAWGTGRAHREAFGRACAQGLVHREALPSANGEGGAAPRPISWTRSRAALSCDRRRDPPSRVFPGPLLHRDGTWCLCRMPRARPIRGTSTAFRRSLLPDPRGRRWTHRPLSDRSGHLLDSRRLALLALSELGPGGTPDEDPKRDARGDGPSGSCVTQQPPLTVPLSGGSSTRSAVAGRGGGNPIESPESGRCPSGFTSGAFALQPWDLSASAIGCSGLIADVLRIAIFYH